MYMKNPPMAHVHVLRQNLSYYCFHTEFLEEIRYIPWHTGNSNYGMDPHSNELLPSEQMWSSFMHASN